MKRYSTASCDTTITITLRRCQSKGQCYNRSHWQHARRMKISHVTDIQTPSQSTVKTCEKTKLKRIIISHLPASVHVDNDDNDFQYIFLSVTDGLTAIGFCKPTLQILILGLYYRPICIYIANGDSRGGAKISVYSSVAGVEVPRRECP